MPEQKMIKYLDSYNGVQGYFLKIFFINPKKNENGWKVTPTSIYPGLATALDTNRFNGKTADLIWSVDGKVTQFRSETINYSINLFR